MPLAFGALIITGGSSGIGFGLLKGFALRYPEATIINISRSAPPKADLACVCKCIEADLLDATQVVAAAERVRTELQAIEKPILLINCSGVGHHLRFQESDISWSLRTIDLNVRASIQLSHALLPLLMRSGGCIATVASTSAFQPTSHMAVYGATKAFLLNWTLALGEDLRGTNLSTMALCPGPTQTPFLGKAGFKGPIHSYWPIMNTSKVVDAFFKGLSKGRPLVIPGLINWAVAALSKTAPILLSTRVAAHIMRRAKG